MAEKVSSLPSKDAAATEKSHRERHNGVFGLVLVNMLFYVADHVLGLRVMQQLYLPLDGPAWYQYVTSMFCHAGWLHLSGNMFFLYLFGKLIEEQEGTLGLLLSYLVCGLGANLLSVLFLSNGVALGASGAVFGLFVVSVLIKLKWNVRSLLEALILGQFVVAQIINETKSLGEKDGVGHLAHVGGALTGVVLVLGVTKLMRRKPVEKKAPAALPVANKVVEGGAKAEKPASAA